MMGIFWEYHDYHGVIVGNHLESYGDRHLIKYPWKYGTSPFEIGKSTVLGHFQ